MMDMPEFDWTHFQRVADALREHGDEASLRSSIGRYYYTAYNEARELLRDVDPEHSPMRGEGSHNKVWEAINALPWKEAKSATRKGKSLKGKRTAADYERHTDADWHKNAELASIECRQVLGYFDTIRARAAKR